MKILLFLFLSVAAFSAYLLVAQHSLIYFPRKVRPSSLPAGVERISYQIDNRRQTAYYLDTGEGSLPPASLWILFGGNASLALEWLPFVNRWRTRDTAFLLFDYPGFGECEGKTDPHSIQKSLHDCLLQLADRIGISFPDLIGRTSLIGHSLGAAVALQAADQFPVRNLILLAAFTSMLEMAKRTVPFPFYHLLRHRYDNLDILDRMATQKTAPVITLFHGTKDGVVPVSMARALARRYPNQIKYIEIEGADHNTVLDLAEPTIHKIMTKAINQNREESL